MIFKKYFKHKPQFGMRSWFISVVIRSHTSEFSEEIHIVFDLDPISQKDLDKKYKPS